MDLEKIYKELTLDRFPRSQNYDVAWMIENEMGPNCIWLTEFLTNKMNLKPGMRVLDLGCGKAMSSIFLAKEFDVEVWATDLWINPTDNLKRIEKQGLENSVYPIYGEAHNLPFGENFFDAIISIDAYHYFGTNELYLREIIKFLKPEGELGIVVPGLLYEFDNGLPEHLQNCWDVEWFTFHTAKWWSNMWQRSKLVDINVADQLPEGWKLWYHWEKLAKESGLWGRNGDIELLEADGGKTLSFSRVVANKSVRSC